MTDGAPTTIDDYIASAPVDKRVALMRLRAHIKAAAPRAEEYIHDGLPAFRFEGKPLVAFGATERSCVLYPLSPAVVESLAEELWKYETTPEAVYFTPGNSLSPGFVKRVVKARIQENRASSGGEIEE